MRVESQSSPELAKASDAGLAIGLAEAGAEVVLASRRLDLLEEVRAENSERGGEADTMELDVTDLDSIRVAHHLLLTGVWTSLSRMLPSQ